jgi:adenylate cyclase
MHWFGRRRRIGLALICALCTGAIIATATFRHVIFANSIWANETAFRDALERNARRTKVHDEFVFLGIDEASKQLDQVSPEEVESSPALQSIRKGYPWERSVHAELIERLCSAGARLIIFDLAFGPDRAGTDQFRAALDRHRDRVVIGADIETNVNPVTKDASIILVPPNRNLIPDGLMDDRVGYVSIWPDSDSVVRRIN